MTSPAFAKTYYDKTALPPADWTDCFANRAGEELIAEGFTPTEAQRNGAAVLLLHGGGWTGGNRRGFLVDALCRAGRPVQFIPTPGSGRGFFYNPDHPWVARLWPAALEWLDRFLLFRA